MVKRRCVESTGLEPVTSLSSGISNNSLEVSQAASELIKAGCKRIGMSLDDYLLAIKHGLSATKSTVDKYGEEHVEDDHATRLKAAAMGLEVEGYMRTKGSDGATNNFFEVRNFETTILMKYSGGK